MIRNIMLSGCTFITKMILQIGVFVYFAKTLSVDDFGLISYAFTLFWFVSNLSDYGFRTKIVKDIAQTSIFDINILKNSDTIKISLAFTFVFIYATYAIIYKTDYEQMFFILSYMLAGLVLSISNGRFAVLQAEGKFSLELKVNVISILIYCISVIIIIDLNLGLYFLSLAFLAYTLFQLFVSSYYSKVKLYYFSIDYDAVKNETKAATPYALLVIANVIFASVDTILIEFYSDYSSVAMYQVFVRVNTGFMLVFNVIYTVLLPKLSRDIEANDYSFIRKINGIVISVACLMVFMYQTLDDVIINVLFGANYMEVVKYSFAISLICIVKYSLWFTNELILVCSNNQKDRVKSYCIGMIFSILLYSIAIPLWGWQGAVVSSLLGIIIIGFIYMYYVRYKLHIYIYSYKCLALIILTLAYVCITTF